MISFIGVSSESGGGVVGSTGYLDSTSRRVYAQYRPYTDYHEYTLCTDWGNNLKFPRFHVRRSYSSCENTGLDKIATLQSLDLSSLSGFGLPSFIKWFDIAGTPNLTEVFLPRSAIPPGLPVRSGGFLAGQELRDYAKANGQEKQKVATAVHIIEPLPSGAGANANAGQQKKTNTVAEDGGGDSGLPQPLFSNFVVSKSDTSNPTQDEQALEIDRSKLLGRGSYGDVYEGTYGGVRVAVKEARGLDGDGVKELQREAKLLRKVTERPNDLVVRCLGVLTDEANGVGQVVMEFMDGGTLHHRVVSNAEPTGRLATESADFLCWTRQVAHGLLFLHTLDLRVGVGIVHRDLKPDNVLLDAQGNARLADFGLAKALSSSRSKYTKVTAGAESYRAPEVVLHDSDEDGPFRAKPAMDVWSYGCVVYFMCSGKHPWHECPTTSNIVSKMMKGRAPRVPDEMHAAVGDRVEALLAGCFEHDAAERPSMAHVVHAVTQLANSGADGTKESKSKTMSASATEITSPSNNSGGADPATSQQAQAAPTNNAPIFS